MKKVLIISYYWPPAGGPGVQRWLKFAKYLPEFGVEPVMFVPENAHYPLVDDSLAAEVPQGLEVIRKPIREPYSLAGLISPGNTRTISSGILPEEGKQHFIQKALLFVRGNFFIPDARKYWVRPSVRFLRDYLREQEIDTIITTGPPHSLHLIGLELKKMLSVRWIADFRDPWTRIGYHAKLKLLPKSRRRHETLEQEVLQESDHLITTSFTTREEFREKTDTPITVITNGYDGQGSSPVKPGKFSISHIGSLLSGRNPENLWEALRELILEEEGFAQAFQLNLVGAVGEPVLKSISAAGLGEYVNLKGYVPHSEAIKYQRAAGLLLLIEIDSEETRGIIPGKLFEYMQSHRPILAVGPETSDVEKLIRETCTGGYFLYPQKEEIKAYIKTCFLEYLEGRLVSRPKGLEQYSRRELTGKLADLLKNPE